MPTSPLPGLPGADASAGTGPAVRSLFETLLDDDACVRPASGAAVRQVSHVLQRHRDAATSWYRDTLGAVHLPAALINDLLACLGPADHALPLVLASDVSGLSGLRQARNMILEYDRVDLVAVHVGLPDELSPAAGARALLDALDFSVPARVDTALAPGWADALAVLAADGAEEVGLDVSGVSSGAAESAPPTVQELGEFLRIAIDRDLTVHAVAGPDHAIAQDGRTGVVNLLCAVRAALNGAQSDEVSLILAETSVAPLASAVRRMSEADAAVVRAFLGSCACADPGSVVDDLVALGLLDPREEG